MSSSTTIPEAAEAKSPTSKIGEASTRAPDATKASRQRFKPQLSCTLCRTRKLKCDRSLPCQNCVKRDLSASCTYVHAGPRGANKQKSVPKSTNSTSQKDVQSQISRLEELVVSLMNKTGGSTIDNTVITDSSRQHSSSENSTSGSPEFTLVTKDEPWTEISTGVKNTTEELGMISIGDDQPNYVGSSHWAAILDNIACLKDTIGKSSETESVKQKEERHDTAKSLGPYLLTGSVAKASRSEILMAMPDRRHVDHLVKLYFGSPDTGAILLHRSTFQKEYENFWRDPATTPIMWIGMLFAILCKSTQFELMADRDPFADSAEVALRDPSDMVELFRIKTVQCLVLGNYAEPGPYTIETLAFYWLCEHFRSPDTMFGLWMLFGMIIRAAYRLGFHRDASHYPNISILQGEMQRRIWSALVHIDLQSSCQVGLPRMIRDGMYDTKDPSNLKDEDFDENTKVLPAPRSDDDLTEIGYHNVKHILTNVFAVIVDFATSIDAAPYEDVMKLDQTLHEAYRDRTPAIFRVQSVDDLQTGTVSTRSRKFTCWETFQKARCYLHRKYFYLSKTTNTYPYPYSMKSCVDAAFDILQGQVYMDGETMSCMPMASERWKTSSLMTHDFLLAGMLICLYLGHCMAVEDLEANNAKIGIHVKPTKDEMLKVLGESQKIWVESSQISKEAATAASALGEMLKKVRAATPGLKKDTSRMKNVEAVVGAPVVTQTESASVNRPSPFPWIQRDISSANPTTLSWQSAPSFDSMTTPSTDSGSDLVGAGVSDADLYAMDLDWDLWDTEFRNAAIGNQTQYNFDTNATVNLGMPQYPQDISAPLMQWDGQL